MISLSVGRLKTCGATYCQTMMELYTSGAGNWSSWTLVEPVTKRPPQSGGAPELRSSQASLLAGSTNGLLNQWLGLFHSGDPPLKGSSALGLLCLGMKSLSVPMATLAVPTASSVSLGVQMASSLVLMAVLTASLAVPMASLSVLMAPSVAGGGVDLGGRGS